MQLHLSKDAEAAILARARAAGFESAEEYILDLLAADTLVDEKPSISRAEWLDRFNAFVARQRSTNPNFDDSRESIYPVR